MFNRTNDRSPTPDMPKEPKRVTPKVFVVILYYTIMQVNDRAVTELIHLKTGDTKFSHRQCRERIEFTEKRFDRKAGDWDADEVGREIAQHVDLDTFLKLAEIDRACEEKLGKHKDIPLDNLKNDQNPFKKAAIKAINEKAHNDELASQKRAHARALDELKVERGDQDLPWQFQHACKARGDPPTALGAVPWTPDYRQHAQEFACGAGESFRFLPHAERRSQYNPPSPRKWNDNADDPFLGRARESRFREDL